MDKTNINNFEDRFYKMQYAERGTANFDVRHEVLLSCLGNVAGDEVLEIGCGNGVFAKKVVAKFQLKKIYGIDISEEAIKSACENGVNGTCLNLDRNNLPYQDNCFDTVICGEVIEHLVDPDHLLEEVYRVLKVNGHLLITTPNLASWYNRLLLLFGYQPLFTGISIRYSYSKPFLVNSCGHLCSYTLASLKFLLERYNFRIIKSIGLKINESVGYGIKYRWLVKLANTIFKSPSLNSGICILARKVNC